MAIKEMKRHWESCQLDYVKEFLCHTEKDVEQLPACCVGSTAYVSETGNWYACGKDQVWKLREEAMEEGGGSGGSGIETFVVNVQPKYQYSSTYVADKTIAEIRSAYMAGKNIICRKGKGIFYQLYDSTDDYAMFGRFILGPDNSGQFVKFQKIELVTGGCNVIDLYLMISAN